MPETVVSQIIAALREDQRASVGKVNAERTRLESRLTGIRGRMDAAYLDKLDGKIPEDFWERKMSEWRMEEQEVKLAIKTAEQRRNRRPSVGRGKDFRTRK